MKNTILILVGVFIIGSIFLLSKSSFQGSTNTGGYGQNENAHNVSIVDAKQIVEIHAKGGYQPQISVAKAGIPTIIRFDTKGTFDCSSSVRIPSMNINKVLPQTGSTDIDIGTGKVGILQGTCGMGMYRFQIQFS